MQKNGLVADVTSLDQFRLCKLKLVTAAKQHCNEVRSKGCGHNKVENFSFTKLTESSYKRVEPVGLAYTGRCLPRFVAVRLKSLCLDSSHQNRSKTA